MSVRARRILTIAVVIVAVAAPSFAQTFQPAITSAATGTIELPLPADGVVSIPIQRTGGMETSAFTVLVSGLQDGTGSPVAGRLNGTQRSDATGLTAPTGITKIDLRIAPVPATGAVTGLLTIATATTGNWRLNLTRGGKPTATLAVDNPSIVRELHCHWLRGCGVPQGEATVHVWEKAHVWPLTNIGVRLEQLTKSGSNFDAPKNLRTFFNGQDLNLWSTWDGRAADSRSVSATGQAEVKFIIRDLEPGEYASTLRLQAANAVADDSQKVTLQIAVKHHWLWAVIVLLAGLAVSLVVTKWLDTVRKRLDIRARISQLNAPWLRQEPPTASVVWASANLRLIRAAAAESLFSIPESLTARLDAVASLINVLRGVHDSRAALAAAHTEQGIPACVIERAHGVLGGIVRRSSDPPLDAAVITALTEELKGLQLWVRPATWIEPYWKDLAPALQALLQDVRPDDVTKPDEREAIQRLVDALKPLTAPNAERPDNTVQVERQYGALKVLWERRGLPEFSALVKAYMEGSVDAVFRLADEHAWERLKKAVDEKGVVIEYSTPEAQALEPFTVTVVPSDPGVRQSFLFRHMLQYDWVVERVSNSDKKKQGQRKRKPFVLRQRTLQPMVSQYAPWAMTVKTSVTIRREGSRDVLTVHGEELTVRPSESLGLFSAFTSLDIVSTILIGAVAVVSGLSTFYFASPAFGAAKDYVALVLWAIAFDQAKNGVIQLSPAKPNGAHA